MFTMAMSENNMWEESAMSKLRILPASTKRVQAAKMFSKASIAGKRSSLLERLALVASVFNCFMTLDIAFALPCNERRHVKKMNKWQKSQTRRMSLSPFLPSKMGTGVDVLAMAATISFGMVMLTMPLYGLLLDPAREGVVAVGCCCAPDKPSALSLVVAGGARGGAEAEPRGDGGLRRMVLPPRRDDAEAEN